jgi:pilus assembly protein Flp/PilA
MLTITMRVLLAIRYVMNAEDGQDLIEYALVIAFIAFAATAGMSSLAGSINSAFTTLGTDLTSAVS